jgi:YegS/Rv2252/BmrU family lipid kinase
MKHFLVINPRSFRTPESLKKIIEDIDNSFSTEGIIDYKTHISRYSRDAIGAVHRYITNCSDDEIVRVYAIGGDGILFDCLNGIVGFPNAELTSVPYGNDNDFLRAFGENVHHRFRDIKALINAPSRSVDIFNCGSNYSMIETQIGFVGETVILTSKLFNRIPEKILRKNVNLAYMLCAIKSMFNDRVMKQHYTLFLDGEDYSGNYCHFHIANTACTGGTMVVSPYAKPDSGFLEVIIASTTRKIDMMRTISDYTIGHYEKHDIYFVKRCKKIEVKSDDVISVEIDGEGFHAKELTLEIIPGGIKFFAPEDLKFEDYSYRAYKSGTKKGKKK